MADWHKCADKTLSPEQFYGKPCWLAVGLASKTNISSLGFLFKDTLESGRERWAYFTRSYLPEGALQSLGENRETFESWIKSGHLTITNGYEVDINHIHEDIKDIARKFEITELLYNPWDSMPLAEKLVKDGLNVLTFSYTKKNMSPAMSEWEFAIREGFFRHNANPVLTWMASNVMLSVDDHPNLYPRINNQNQSITSVITGLMAVNRALLC